jgi:hypothetical protein
VRGGYGLRRVWKMSADGAWMKESLTRLQILIEAGHFHFETAKA